MQHENITLGMVQEVLSRLGGTQGVKRFLLGQTKVVDTNPREFYTWTRLKIGCHKSPSEYHAAIQSSKLGIDEGGKDLLSRIVCSQVETDLDLVMESVRSLGFNYARYTKIVDRAQEIGLDLCPAEVGPALLLHLGNRYWEQPIMIAMRPFSGRGMHDDPYTFRLVGRATLSLSLYRDINESDYLSGYTRLVFTRRQD